MNYTKLSVSEEQQGTNNTATDLSELINSILIQLPHDVFRKIII